MSSLTRIVPWCHQLVAEVLKPGDLAVDLTAGKGRDTLVLVQAVGEGGQVVAFDLQAVALEQTAQYLESHNIAARYGQPDQPLSDQAGVVLVPGCHTSLGSVVTKPPQAIIANLGYLPGGDPSLITEIESTLEALRQALDLLAAGGRLAVVVYPGHPGGREEGDAVQGLFAELSREEWQVLSLVAANRPEAPYLLVAERR